MTNKDLRPVIFDIIMAIIVGIFFIASWGYNSKARFVPLIIATPTLAIAIGRVVVSINYLIKGKTAVKQTASASELTGEALLDRMAAKTEAHGEFHVDAAKLPGKVSLSPAERRRKELAALFWIAILLVMVWLFGLIWTIPLFIFLSLKVRSREKWPISIILSLGGWAFMYILFVYLLKIQFENGVLIELFLG